MCVTHILFSSFAFLPSFPALCVSHFGAETGYIVEALLGVPLLPALLASKAEFLVLVLSLGIGAAKITVNILVFRVKKKKTQLASLIYMTAVCRAEMQPLTPSCWTLSWVPEKSLYPPSCLLPRNPVCQSFLEWGGGIKHLKSQFDNIVTHSYFA